MSNGIKSTKQMRNNRCAKQNTGGLINSNMNERVYTCSSNKDDEDMNVLYSGNESCKCYETEFVLRSLMSEGRSSSSVSQFLPSCSWSACQMAVNRKDGYRGDLSPWLFWQLCFCSVWGRCPAERGEQTLRCAQLSARLSAELCSPGLRNYHTTLRCTESVHFLWPLNRKFSG